jgi:xanthine/uracil/vitamin C permease (AzgA family)
LRLHLQTWWQLDFAGYAAAWQHTVPITLVLLFVCLFDTAGVQFAAGAQAKLLDSSEQLPAGASRAAFAASAVATSVGAALGTSSVIIHNEVRFERVHLRATKPPSSQCLIVCMRYDYRLLPAFKTADAPVKQPLPSCSCAPTNMCLCTGLSALTVAFLFLVSLPFTPLLQAIPPIATAPPLIIGRCNPPFVNFFICALLISHLCDDVLGACAAHAVGMFMMVCCPPLASSSCL